MVRKWFVTTVLTLPTHVLQPHRILYGFSVMSQKQLFRVFQLFATEVRHFYQKNTWKNSKILARNLLGRSQSCQNRSNNLFHL